MCVSSTKNIKIISPLPIFSAYGITELIFVIRHLPNTRSSFLNSECKHLFINGSFLRIYYYCIYYSWNFIRKPQKVIIMNCSSPIQYSRAKKIFHQTFLEIIKNIVIYIESHIVLGIFLMLKLCYYSDFNPLLNA